MSASYLEHKEKVVVRPDGLEQILYFLKRGAYRTIGPKIENGAIVLHEIHSVKDLPVGWQDVQAAGTYTLEYRNDNLFFGYAVGPHSWKKYLYPEQVRIWQARRKAGGVKIINETPKPTRYAFLGVRPCELHAISSLDRVLNTHDSFDPGYALRRKQAFILAVNCSVPGANCFCVSMNTGPESKSGFDIVLTEVQDPDDHFFIAGAGSTSGKKLLDEIDSRKASDNEIGMAQQTIDQAAAKMGRSLDTSNLKSLFFERYEHPHWDESAKKCLTCGNCTMVCPTCFCHTVEDSASLSGDYTERRRRWDSCFTQDFSYLHGGSVRSSAKSRFRQWLTHKLSTSTEQFGRPGCVGCGRCITWCPVGIDIRREAQIILQEQYPPALKP